jgi:hypothetical protein
MQKLNNKETSFMVLRIAASITALTLLPTIGFSEIINLRNSCDKWEHIPANEALKSPAAALLQCTDDNGTWLAMQIMCFSETAEIELRYRPSYPIVSPIPTAATIQEVEVVEVAQNTTTLEDQTSEPEIVEPAMPPLGEKEMLFFDFPNLGVTSVVKYDFDNRDWSYRERQPLAPLFRSLISGNYADVALLATSTSERLPLRGSTKALRPVVETCRIAKKALDKKAETEAQD